MENKLIYKKMVAVMQEVGAIGKGQTNSSQGFKFRGIDDMLNNFYPVLVRNGIFVTTRVLNHTDVLKDVTRNNGKLGVDKHVSIDMEYTFNAEDGSSVSSSVPAEGLDSGDKATNKALSAALKYALIQTFSIPTVDMEDADRTSPEISRATVTTSAVSNPEVKQFTNSTPFVNTPAISPNTVVASTPPRTSFRKPPKPAVVAPVASVAQEEDSLFG